VDEQELCGPLDWLMQERERIESALARRHLKNGTLVLVEAKAGLNRAILDATPFGVPVYEMLVRDAGTRCWDPRRHPCLCQWLVWRRRDRAEFAKAAERPLRDGYDALKCHPLAYALDRGLRSLNQIGAHPHRRRRPHLHALWISQTS
jgi:hypothetical protein